MHIRWTLLLSILLAHTVRSTPARRTYDTHDYYVVEHDPNTPDGASLGDVARALGVELVEQAGELRDHWLVRIPKPEVNKRGEGDSDPVVAAFDSLRQKAASNLAARDNDHARSVSFSTRTPSTRKAGTTACSVMKDFGIRDPLFSQQWHIVNEDDPEHMMNVTGVWEMGLTGKGVLSSLIDDGLDYTHDDLAANFDAANSYDFNDHEALPTPKTDRDHHGTRCAGQIAAIKNDVCGVGIAYDSKVAGLRILSAPISDVDEAAALNYGYQDVSIYSCSWGPRDNGEKMQGPGYLVKKAVVNGINNGRQGKGSIFVFASGNGGGYGDQCNFDGYTNSIYSVTVSSVDHKGLHPYYSEACAANMIVAYSSGDGEYIVTTDRGKNECATNHGGTSAAAPNAVGVFALALEARPDLTWRDIQYLCVETAQMINPNDPDWERMASGRMYSYKYGFGVLDAYRYVTVAKDWKLVKPQAWLATETIQLDGGTMDAKKTYTGGRRIGHGVVKSAIKITKDMMVEHNLETLEHITVKVWIDHTRRGDVEVEIVSPRGIRSILAGSRERDDDKTGFPGWKFMSVKHWGENPVGEWTIKVSDQQEPEGKGYFLGWNMVLWGTTIDPSKAKKYEVPLVENLLPANQQGAPSRPSIFEPTSVLHAKPTDLLHGGPGSAAGENTKVAFPSKTASPNAADDEGWLSSLALTKSKQRALVGAIGLLVLLNIGTATYFWRRKRASQSSYNALDGEDVPLGAVGNGGAAAARSPRRRALYDVVEEDGEETEDEGDENTALAGRTSAKGLGFHSSFLDDDEPLTAEAATPKYSDQPSQVT
ncbi:uncharacterized protein LACBIDRAFT_248825 [Laccaria bicolor S238N-H82]|uniref:Predicted protein n=1 Tax=Laccaria bicolor (strain S238N-H82 / ATCC MYA-4686) TaxID=486041 RepID=B0D776_LACBS|nr:uncharacterized protein LACBIDRAFT_248825 [Laccaria bicolor S238N-H82]EDR09349.1 predicted protein [Laccaria bicolor S238N-H82]|eukprot:XP_001879698.1 predicted protein [Laccaria bicolor S238N-H82]